MICGCKFLIFLNLIQYFWFKKHHLSQGDARELHRHPEVQRHEDHEEDFCQVIMKKIKYEKKYFILIS